MLEFFHLQNSIHHRGTHRVSVSKKADTELIDLHNKQLPDLCNFSSVGLFVYHEPSAVVNIL